MRPLLIAVPVALPGAIALAEIAFIAVGNENLSALGMALGGVGVVVVFR
jgi:hypothetical protein